MSDNEKRMIVNCTVLSYDGPGRDVFFDVVMKMADRPEFGFTATFDSETALTRSGFEMAWGVMGDRIRNVLVGAGPIPERIEADGTADESDNVG